MSEKQKTLYERLGGYDAIAAVANDPLPRLRNDPQLGRFWKNRAEDSIMREKQLLIDFLRERRRTNDYRVRDVRLSHRGVGTSESDWSIYLGRSWTLDF